MKSAMRTEDLGWQIDGVTVLSGVNVTIRRGVMTMVVGLNG